MKTAVLLLTLAACFASRAPTWRDAWAEESAAWCDYELRCIPEWFYNHFPDRASCVYVQVDRACEQKAQSPTEACGDDYPRDREPALDQCAADLEALYCGALFPPDSCFEAFQ